MVRKLVLTLIAVLGLMASVSAQNRQVSGTVKDAGGAPVVGATVVVDGTSRGTTTNVDGTFVIAAPANATLTVSFIGYKSQQVAVNGQTTIAVVLDEDTQAIDDVVVLGYGTGKKIGTVVGSVAQVKAETIESRPSNNVVDALQGQVAGLQIMTGSGEVDATSSIRLHGYGSINAGNEPLILLDGSPITTGTLLAMNQNDIASINVLKDASATSIYGSRAANGVIYVQSKRGRYNEDVNITLRTQYSISSPTQPKVTAMNTEQLIDYTSRVEAIFQGMDPNDPEQLAAVRNFFVNAYEIDETVNTNWFDEIMNRNAPLYQVDLGVSGGTKKSSYYFSSNYSDQTGVLPGSEMTRYTFRSNIETRIKDWIKAGMSMGVGFYKSSNTFSLQSMGTNWFSNPINAVTLMPSYQPAYDENGDPIQILDYAGGYASPLVLSDLFPQNKERLQLNGAMFLELNPVKGLTIRTNLAANAFDYKYKYMNSPDYYYNNGSGSVQNMFQRNYDWTWTNTVEYAFDIESDHHVTLLGGHESIYGTAESSSMTVRGITDSRFPFVNQGTTPSIPTYSFGEYAFNSVFGRGEYNYAEKYFADFSLRYDASSRFGSANRGATFWSVGGMWNAKKEDFLADSKVISALSFKASYGTAGNSGIGNYAQYPTLAATTYNGRNGWRLASPGNPALAWEKQATLTIGAEVGFANKVRLSAEWYRRQTTNMLMDVPIPATTGFTENTVNVGGMRNSGIDLTFNWDIYQTKDWFVNFHATFNYNRNQITALWDGLQEYALDEISLMAVGEPYFMFYMNKWLGVNPQTGEPQWATSDGGVTNNPDEAAFFNTGKSFQAPYTGGFGVNVSWKGLALTADFSWVHGNYMFNNTMYFSENPLFADWTTNQTTGALDYWKQPGDVTKYPSLEASINAGGRNYYDDSMIERASFLRLKNIQLSYTMPSSWFKKNKFISGIKLYVGARNLWTVTGYTGLDPEVDSDYSLDNYPASRQWTFGAEFKF